MPIGYYFAISALLFATGEYPRITPGQFDQSGFFER